MNTNPDEAVLARWLEDELEGAAAAAFEGSISGREDLYVQRAAIRALRTDLAALIPAAQEPAYPEFFNARVAKTIRESGGRVAGKRVGGWSWGGWWVPAAAFAGMVMTFWLGTRVSGRQVVVEAQAPAPVAQLVVEPAVYTPERGVDAEWFASEEAGATVIVLEGVEAIPDNLDFSQTAGLPGNNRGTAGVDAGKESGVRQ